MNFFITNYLNSPSEDQEMELLLKSVFVGEGFADKSLADKLFAASEVKKRGTIFFAKSSTNKLLGMIICAAPPNPACRVAQTDEVELQLFAIHKNLRGQGISFALIDASEQHAIFLGFKKVVLSTQPTMKAAHKVYTRHNYVRNPDRDWQGNEIRFLVYEKSIGHV